MSVKKITTKVYYKYEVDDIKDTHKAILCTLGGMSASIPGQKDKFEKMSLNDFDNNIAIPIWGSGQMFTRSSKITNLIIKALLPN